MRSRNWNTIPENKKQAWVEKMGKEITRSENRIEKYKKKMEKAGVFKGNKVAGYSEYEIHKLENKDRMVWFKGGRF